MEPSSHVWVLDCRFHTSERGPSMLSRRNRTKAMASDGKFYVVRGSPEKLSVEVLDPAVGHWEAIPSPFDGIAKIKSFVFKLVDGKISVGFFGEKFLLDPKTKTWEVLRYEKPLSGSNDFDCVVVEEMSYKCNWLGEFEIFDKEIGVWKELKGTREGMPKKSRRSFTLVNLDGRLVVAFSNVSYTDLTDSKKVEVTVWCAEMDVWKDNDGDWLGQVHWSEKVRFFLNQVMEFW